MQQLMLRLSCCFCLFVFYLWFILMRHTLCLILCISIIGARLTNSPDSQLRQSNYDYLHWKWLRDLLFSLKALMPITFSPLRAQPKVDGFKWKAIIFSLDPKISASNILWKLQQQMYTFVLVYQFWFLMHSQSEPQCHILVFVPGEKI